MNIKKIIATYTRIIAAAEDGSVYSTLLSSINWTATTGLPSGVNITSLATDGSDVFLGTYGNGVYQSTDGNTWSGFNSGLTNMNITSLAIRGLNIFAATNGTGIFKRSGSSWIGINNGLPTMNILSLCASGQYVAAGYKGGVYVTTSDGYEWKAPNVLLYIPSYADVHTLSFTPSSTRIFAATPYNTIYSNSVTELPTTAVEPTPLGVVSPKIGNFSISPNPNNGNFKLDLSNITGEVEEIIVYNYSGEEAEHIDKPDDSLIRVNYPKGIYFVRIITSKGTSSQKVIIE
jgi:hypothetical protein